MFLGDVIKEYRNKNNLSMDKFSNKSGLSKSYISILEKNLNPTTGKEIEPTFSVMQKCAKAMNIDVNDLINMLDKNQPIKINNKFEDSITKKEKNLISTYRKLDSEKQEKVSDYADYQLNKMKKEQENNVIQIADKNPKSEIYEPETIAAHSDSEELENEDIEAIEEAKAFVRGLKNKDERNGKIIE